MLPSRRAFVPGGASFLTLTRLPFTGAQKAACIPLTGPQMIRLGIWRGNNAHGGMRSAFPPLGCESPLTCHSEGAERAKNLITTRKYEILRSAQDDNMAFRSGLNLA